MSKKLLSEDTIVDTTIGNSNNIPIGEYRNFLYQAIGKEFIDSDGTIQLRFFLNKVDKHREYIENAPVHIKNAFIFDGGDCTSCNKMCAPGKTYTIDGQLMQKCNHSTFYFHSPAMEKLADYMELFSKFYPTKKQNKP